MSSHEMPRAMPRLAENFSILHRPARERAARYAKLDQRNRVITILRWAVPITIAFGASLILATSLFGSALPQGSAASIRVDANRVLIDAPSYSGLMDDGTRYQVTAGRADVPISQPDLFLLSHAKIETIDEEGYWMRASAQEAELQLAQGTVTVDRTMQVNDSAGVSGTFENATLNWPEQRMNAKGAANLKMEDGATIVAQRAAYGPVVEVATAPSDPSPRWQFFDATYTQAAPSDGTERAIITADELQFSRSDLMALFLGNAQVKRAETNIFADLIRTDFGASGSSNFKSLQAQGNVRIALPNGTLSGEKGHYDPRAESFTLNENVEFQSESGMVRAPQMVHLIDRQITRFSGAQSQVEAKYVAQDPVTIFADVFETGNTSEMARFSGNVRAIQPGLNIQAAQITVHNGAQDQEISRYEARRNVVVRTANQTSRGDVAVYDPATRILQLTGNVTVNNGQGNVRAPSFRVNLRTGVSTFTSSSSGGGGRVNGTFSQNN